MVFNLLIWFKIWIIYHLLLSTLSRLPMLSWPVFLSVTPWVSEGYFKHFSSKSLHDIRMNLIILRSKGKGHWFHLWMCYEISHKGSISLKDTLGSHFWNKRKIVFVWYLKCYDLTLKLFVPNFPPFCNAQIKLL